MSFELGEETAQQALITFIASRFYAAVIDGVFHGAARLAKVSTILEPAMRGPTRDLRESKCYVLRVVDRRNEFANSRRVDEASTVAKHMHDGSRCRVSALHGSAGKTTDRSICFRYQPIDQ